MCGVFYYRQIGRENVPLLAVRSHEVCISSWWLKTAHADKTRQHNRLGLAVTKGQSVTPGYCYTPAVLLLLSCCCTAGVVCLVAARCFVTPSAVGYLPAPAMLAETTGMCPFRFPKRQGWYTHARTRRSTARLRREGKIPMRDCCCIVATPNAQSLNAGRTAVSYEQQKKRKKTYLV